MVEVKERPILFNGEMVRAILEGRKTMTRRVIKPQPKSGGAIYDPSIGWRFKGGPNMPCPYGQPGDRLWVRETWAPLRLQFDYESGYCDGWEECSPKTVKDYRDSDSGFNLLDPPRFDIAYFDCYDCGTDDPKERGFKWRSSIHMPRWASRIDLLVKDVRVERVQDINNLDALAEGIPDTRTMENNWDLRDCFHSLWDSIYAKKGNGWEANPWVWVVEFKTITKKG